MSILAIDSERFGEQRHNGPLEKGPSQIKQHEIS